VSQGEKIRGAGKADWNLEELVQDFQKNMNADALYYMEKRGITQESIEQFRIGFEPGRIGFYVAKHPLGDYFENRVIIPVLSEEGQIVDLVGRAVDLREPKYKALYGLEDSFFPESVLAESDDVVLCNGIFDAMTLAQANLPGVCIPNMLGFKEVHAERFKGKRVFICMGNDETGRREARRMQNLLEPHAAETFIVQLPEAVRDINDMFVRVQSPVEVFVKLLNLSIEETLYAPVAPDIRQVTVFNEEYMKRHRGSSFHLATGLERLDAMLSGGLPNGITLIAGEPSSGKTTFLKQIADRAALLQQPVIYMTWDQSPFELWSMSIARAMGVSRGSVLRGEHEPEHIYTANQAYMQAGKMQWTLEFGSSTKLAQMEASVERVMAVTGKPPILIIDDLNRFMAAAKEASSGSCFILKEWAREWNTAILAAVPSEGELSLSLDQRATADVLLYLKPLGWAADRARALKLMLLKNRNGKTGEIPIKFYEDRTLFTDIL